MKIEGYKGIVDVPSTEYDGILAIDYDDLTSSLPKIGNLKAAQDLMRGYERLKQEGVMALGFRWEDLCLGKKKIDKVYSVGDSFVEKLTKDLVCHLPQQEDLDIAVPTLGFYDVYMFLFTLSLAMEERKKVYRKITLHCLEELKEGEEKVVFESMLRAFFPKAEVNIQGIQEKSPKGDILYTQGYSDRSHTFFPFLKEETLVYEINQEGERPFPIERRIGKNDLIKLCQPRNPIQEANQGMMAERRYVKSLQQAS